MRPREAARVLKENQSEAELQKRFLVGLGQGEGGWGNLVLESKTGKEYPCPPNPAHPGIDSEHPGQVGSIQYFTGSIQHPPENLHWSRFGSVRFARRTPAVPLRPLPPRRRAQTHHAAEVVLGEAARASSGVQPDPALYPSQGHGHATVWDGAFLLMPHLRHRGPSSAGAECYDARAT